MNRILAITRNTIPYVKELRALVDSVAGCVLMQQLDYWFDRYPNGFYKFQSPTEHPQYKPEQSWTEELGFSKDEFRTAFDKIGVRYKSKSEYRAAPDKFQGKFYCSYHDRSQGLTYYYRNHDLVDKALDGLLAKPSSGPSNATPAGKPPVVEMNEHVNQHQDNVASVGNKNKLIAISDSQFTVSWQPQFTVNQEVLLTVNPQSSLTGNRVTQYAETDIPDLLETGNPDLHITETTKPETTSELQQLPVVDPAPNTSTEALGSGGSDDLIFSENLSPKDITAIKKIFVQQKNFSLDVAQLILDELSGVMRNGKLRGNPVSFVVSLAKRQESDLFVPAHAIEIQAAREKAKTLSEMKSTAPRTPQGKVAKSEDQIKEGRKGLDSIKSILSGSNYTPSQG